MSLLLLLLQYLFLADTQTLSITADNQFWLYIDGEQVTVTESARTTYNIPAHIQIPVTTCLIAVQGADSAPETFRPQ